MVLFLYTSIIAINLLVAYCEKNIKIVQLLSFLGIAILMCGYRRPFFGDLDNYGYMFNGSMSTSIGLELIFKVFRSIGLDFWQTHYILIIILLGVVFYILKKFTLSPHLAIALFTGYYIIISSDQIKNHTALIFLLLLLVALYEKKIVKAIVFFAIASLIHYSFIVYGILFLLQKENVFRSAWTFVVPVCCITFLEMTGVGDVLILFISSFEGVVESTLGAYGLAKLQNYTENRTSYGYILLFAFQFINYFFVKFSSTWMKENGICEKKIIEINDFVIKINLLGFLLFPLFVYNQQWYRLIRDMLIINYCAIGNAFYYLRMNSDKWIYVMMLSIISVAIWLIGDLCIKTVPQSVLFPFFANNAFL